MDDIRVAHNPSASRYELSVDGEVASVAEYVMSGGAFVFDHTETWPRFRGRGFAERVVRFALDDVRATGGTIVPACWFVGEFVQNHPEYRDLLVAQRRAG